MICPGFLASMALDKAEVEAVACPSAAVMTSPVTKPAVAAALPGSTAAITTPGVPLGVEAMGLGRTRSQS